MATNVTVGKLVNKNQQKIRIELYWIVRELIEQSQDFVMEIALTRTYTSAELILSSRRKSNI